MSLENQEKYAKTWYALVDVSSSIFGAYLMGEYQPSGEPLTSGISRSGMDGNPGDRKMFSIDIPAGAVSANFSLKVPHGAYPDMYVKYGSPPVITGDNAEGLNWDCRLFQGAGGDEFCAFSYPRAGIWYVAVDMLTMLSGAQLTAAYEMP